LKKKITTKLTGQQLSCTGLTSLKVVNFFKYYTAHFDYAGSGTVKILKLSIPDAARQQFHPKIFFWPCLPVGCKISHFRTDPQ
jgi:hypothetical protein